MADVSDASMSVGGRVAGLRPGGAWGGATCA
jgi:hypothetical protein